MTDDLEPAARAGVGTLPGACWRRGDARKHLGPPEHLGIPFRSQLFETRCGLTVKDGEWLAILGETDDYWCPACLTQGGWPFELYAEVQP